VISGFCCGVNEILLFGDITPLRLAITDVSGQLMDPILNIQAVQQFLLGLLDP
jgi:hypothetical protein